MYDNITTEQRPTLYHNMDQKPYQNKINESQY